jgi:hypothetical protein
MIGEPDEKAVKTLLVNVADDTCNCLRVRCNQIAQANDRRSMQTAGRKVGVSGLD